MVHDDAITRSYAAVMLHGLSCVIQTGRRGCLDVALYVITGPSADVYSRLYDPGESMQQAERVQQGHQWEQFSHAKYSEA